jgi:hypothetical protein
MSATNRNEYQGYLLSGKDGRRLGLTTLDTFMCLLSINIGSLNFLERYEPVKACNGIELSLPLPCDLYLPHSYVTVRHIVFLGSHNECEATGRSFHIIQSTFLYRMSSKNLRW